MSDRCHTAGRSRRGNDTTVGRERFVDLDTAFDVDLFIVVDGDVTTGGLDLRRADEVPDFTASLRNDGRKLCLAGSQANDGQRPRGEHLDLNLVFHRAPPSNGFRKYRQN